jgi:23S rRNA (cytosine1962-C5)-methyltransferase/23S rRNA (guanine2445-N2)-methyltransferase / 23S rRNA (guanine2069-N7)-methyltransferase
MEDSSIILNRLKKNLKARKSLVKNGLNTAYRLYEKDIPEYPYIIDVYNQYAVISEKGKKLDDQDAEQRTKHKNHLNLIKLAVMELLKIDDSQLIVKEWKKPSIKEQNNPVVSNQNFIKIVEHDFKFKVNLHDDLNMGLFLDHRPLRQIIYKSSQDKKVLSLFAYTGGFAVAAAKGGAQVTTVDMSNTYLSWAQDNFEINELPSHKHQFVKADALTYIQDASIGKFDIIVLDPPSFSSSKTMRNNFVVQDEHYLLIKQLTKRLTPNGVIYFANSYRDFVMDSKMSEQFFVKDITKKTIPFDFRNMKIHNCFEIRNKDD